MYSSFFGLNEKPFAITPDPRYLYLSRRHAEALAHLLYGITESGGFIQLTGEVGTGKTTLVRSLLEQLPEHAEVALVLNPRLSPQEFLLTICDELHVEVPHRDSQMEVVNALNRRLLEAHSAGQRVVLIVDEAQNLSADVLEQIRLLTNLETAKQKLLQIILIGQPELREVLARSDLRQLAQRITGRYHLEPLEADELRAYVQHRLEVAGSRAEIFTPGAHRVLHRVSRGIPRLVNVIADRALLGAWSQEEHKVTAPMTSKAATEVFGGSAGRKRAPATGLTRVAIGLAVIGIAILAGVVTALVREYQSAEPAAAAHVSAGRPAGTGPPQGSVMPIQRATTLAPQVVAAEAEAAPQAPADALPPPPASLAERLAEGELGTGTDAAFTALFSLWELEYTPEAGPACEQAAARGLRCLLQRGSWGELGRLDRPAIIVLTDRDGRDHQVVLAGLAQDGARILAGESSVTIPLGELLTLWYGEYLMLWRPAAGDGRVLARNASGTDVLWLRRTLGELRGAPVAPADSSVYDASLESAVREYQRNLRLVDDGIAGAMTLISLHNTVGLGGRPRLREAD
jgi:general secretion pathway protein A